MLAVLDIADYWKDPAVPTPVMQAVAPEFAPVFPGHYSLKRLIVDAGLPPHSQRRLRIDVKINL